MDERKNVEIMAVDPLDLLRYLVFAEILSVMRSVSRCRVVPGDFESDFVVT